MGGNLGRKTKKPDPNRSKAAKKAAKTRARNERRADLERERARKRSPRTVTVGLSRSASEELEKFAQRKTGGSPDKALETLIFAGGRFVTKQKRRFQISQDADKELKIIKERYNLSAETIIERLLTRR